MLFSVIPLYINDQGNCLVILIFKLCITKQFSLATKIFFKRFVAIHIVDDAPVARVCQGAM